MELLLQPDQFERVYNCQANYYDPELGQSEQTNFFVSLSLITVWLFFNLLYLPCIRVIYIGRNRYACFQFMYYIGLMDILSLNVSALISSILQINNWSFCTSPKLIYAIGCFYMGVWLIESAISVLLAICRCLEVFTPQKAEEIFGGLNGRMMVLFCVFYGFLGAYFTKPQVYSTLYMAWISNPHAGYVKSKHSKILYQNAFYLIHNIIFIVAILLLYTTFAVISGIRLKRFKKTGKLKFNKAQKRSFIQVFIISIINASGAIMSIYLQQINPTSGVFTFSAAFISIVAHGFPAILYLTINKTIQNGCKKLIRRAQLHSVAILPVETMGGKTSYGEKSAVNTNPRIQQRSI